MDINITLPDGAVRRVPSGTSAMQIAESISSGLARNVLAAKVNGEIWDSTRPISEDSDLQLLTWDQDGGKSTMWHSSAHLMAEALEALYPGIKLGIGPPIENGFYYDVDFGEQAFSSDDFPKIEAKMKELAKQKNTFKRKDVSKTDALNYFREKGDEYKLELISELTDGSITFYEQGEFVDLCKGPHIPDTGKIKAIKLLSTAAAYWRGDEKRRSMTRIFGITFPKQKMLEEYLLQLEEAKKRDH